MEEIFFSINIPVIKVVKPKNNDKNRGISIRANGIRFLNISSCVRDIEIQ